MAGKARYKVGDVIGDRELVELTGHDKHRTALWMWKCLKCGTVQGPSRTNRLIRLQEAKCCWVRPTGDKAGRWKGHKEISGVYLGQLRYGAKKRGYEFTVTPEQMWKVWELQGGKCRYTGWPLEHGHTASLDRIDNSKGYIPGNIQWVHKLINNFKSDYSEGLMLSLCRQLVEYDNALRTSPTRDWVRLTLALKNAT